MEVDGVCFGYLKRGFIPLTVQRRVPVLFPSSPVSRRQVRVGVTCPPVWTRDADHADKKVAHLSAAGPDVVMSADEAGLPGR